MDMIDPLEVGADSKDFKDGECSSPTVSEAAAMVAAENCLVVEGELGMDQDDIQRPVVVTTSDAGTTVTYRVVQVAAPGNASVAEEVDNISHIINPTASFTTGAASAGVQVLTSPINGQFYVIGSPQEVFAASSTNARTIAPRGQNDAVRSTTRRDERRRATHNEVERRRRDKINSWIMKLGKIIPDCANDGGKQSQVSFEGQSKGGILAKACDYIQELRADNQRMTENLKESERLALQVEVLGQQNEELRRERLALHSQLTQNGIEPIVDLGVSAEIIVGQESLS